MHMQHNACIALFAAWLSGVGLFAQTTTAELTGKITDPSGSSVPAASVIVLNVDTGTKRDTTSNQSGIYAAPSLQPGMYRITVQKEGFKPVSRSGVQLEVDQVKRLDFQLDVGAL